MTRACVHFCSHDHPVKNKNYSNDIAKGDNLVKELVLRTPMATNSTIILEATKEMVGDMLVAPNGVQQKTLVMVDLLPRFDCCKHFRFGRISNKVTSFRYFCRFGIMDSITKL